MASKMTSLELCCMEPENYRKYFRALFWSSPRRFDKDKEKISKRENLIRSKFLVSLSSSHAPPLLGNPSHFAVYAAVRKTILTHWKQLNNFDLDWSDESDDDETYYSEENKVNEITVIGLRSVFALISKARTSNADFCEEALKALFDVLQGNPPEFLNKEPDDIIANLHEMLVEVATASVNPSALTAHSAGCLLALSVARGNPEIILQTVASLLASPPLLLDQYIPIPSNLLTLQRSVQGVILGTSARNQWLKYGVPEQCLFSSFPVDLPPLITSGRGDLIVRSLTSDGCHLYLYTSKGLLKVGSGYGSSIRQHVYVYKPDFFLSDRHGWLGFCKNKLYVRIGRKKTEIYDVDIATLETKNVIKLDLHPPPVEPKSAIFSDGKHLGLIVLTKHDTLTVKMYDVDAMTERLDGTYNLSPFKEFSVHLLRRKILVLGRAPFDDQIARRPVDIDSPYAIQLEDNDDDPLVSIASGQEFALLVTASGKVYYTGKTCALGYKVSNHQFNKWNVMKDPVFTQTEPNVKRGKVIQVAVGHEGTHAILVLDNGTALFTGMARRGEDGDGNKHRRVPKITRPKAFSKVDGHYIVYAACNYGSTALVTRLGLLLMFGKDTQHCDPEGVVTGLHNEKIVQVALGKAHAVALTSSGQVFTFGINNKGQCGREFVCTKEKSKIMRRPKYKGKDLPKMCPPSLHTWVTESCKVCVMCRECTGFSSSCPCTKFPNRIPRENCGCGLGDSGCSICGVCRRCVDMFTAQSDHSTGEGDDDADASSTRKCNKLEEVKVHLASEAGGDLERESGVKVTSMPPARVAVPGAHKVAAVAAGLHHTVLLTEYGEVLAFGSNQFGQLGAGDIAAHHRIIRVRVPRASHIAAGSNHTALITTDGELFTFGSFLKGTLGRECVEEVVRGGGRGGHSWYAAPARVPRLGPRHACKAVWLSASGDQTFVHMSQSIVNTDSLFSATITANDSTIIIVPNRPEHAFKCLTINTSDGNCNAWTGSEQVDFVNSLATLDPLYNVLWCFQPQMRVMKCFNILAFDSHTIQKCCASNSDYTAFQDERDSLYPHFGNLRKLDEYKNEEEVEIVCRVNDKQIDNITYSNNTILNQELAIPNVADSSVTRIHAALHMLGCLDSLIYARDNKLSLVECNKENSFRSKDDFLWVDRFESNGGGWGYPAHSIEAIRFMCDSDILLGGFGLFGGRGDYSAKLKLFDLGQEGGEHEGDGVLLAETDEINYDCEPRDKALVFFDEPVPIYANRWYLVWASVAGPTSDCGSSGQAMVLNDGIAFYFKASKKSNNGTDVNSGQIATLLYNLVTEGHVPILVTREPVEYIMILSKNLSRKVTIACFRSLITILKTSWSTYKATMLDTNGQVPITYQKLIAMKHQKRLVFVVRACLRLIKGYINEVYPQDPKKRNSQEFMSYLEIIADIRNIIQSIMSDETPNCSMLPKKLGKNKMHRTCYVQLALELSNSVLAECHETITSCFHAFFPTPSLKWNQLCSLLYLVNNGKVPPDQVRELSSYCEALCVTRDLRDVLAYVVPLTQTSLLLEEHKRPESKVFVKPDVPTKSATVPRSAHANKPPPIPPRTASRESNKKPTDIATGSKGNFVDWHLLDVIPRLLDIILIPIKDQMMTRQCGQPHDHGEIKQNELLTKNSCKLIARTVSELIHGVKNIRNDMETSSSVKHLVTSSRFMRVNHVRAWNTGNGSADAICFTVDRSGIQLVGIGVYVGTGNYEYELELLNDVRAPNDDGNHSYCWVSLEIANGTFTAADANNDIINITFERPVTLREKVTYAVRVCSVGARTVNGDCGLPSVKGPDGTMFRFSSCPLSYNGTSLARGQIPCLVYYSTSNQLSCNGESSDTMLIALRAIMLRVTARVMERTVDMFCNLRNELTAEDLKRNARVLQQSPAITTLIPYTLASLDGLNDSKSTVQILEMIQKLLPHVAAINLLLPAPDEVPPATTSNHYTWVESDHPYKPATLSNLRVLFPSSVSWIVLEMDPRSITAQPEDSLTVYAAANNRSTRCHCTKASKRQKPHYKKRYIPISSEAAEAEEHAEDSGDEASCLHYNCAYVAVLPKMANVATAWPQKAIVVPGNEVVFSFEAASDYLKDYKKHHSDEMHFGFRCLCVGYEEAPPALQHGLVALEMELAHAGAACAAKLLAPDLNMSPSPHAIVMDVQSVSNNADDSEASQEAILLSRGLEINTPPTIYQVIDGQPLLRSSSTERQFLCEFVAGAESTAGGRLAQWLSPEPKVDPTKCELRAPGVTAKPSVTLTLPVLLRDQYGDLVSSSALKVEVLVQKVEDACWARGSGGEAGAGASWSPDVPDVAYRPVVRDSMCFHAITMMKEYQKFSLEELRFASGTWVEAQNQVKSGPLSGRAPAERLVVRSLTDGTYIATWTPKAPGSYVLRCTLDEKSMTQELNIDVVSDLAEELAGAGSETQPGTSEAVVPIVNVLRTMAEYTAGVRVRASPCLEAEELGAVPPASKISYVQEVVNKDGTWVRLSSDSLHTYTDTRAKIAWCMKYHSHTGLDLLAPSSPDQSDVDDWEGQPEPDANSLPDEDLELKDSSADEEPQDAMFAAYDFGNEFEEGSPRCEANYLPEPDKRNRLHRSDSYKNLSPSRLQRRTNGNGGNDEWWTPENNSDNSEGEQSNSASGLAQAGTQTSLESNEDVVSTSQYFVGKDGRSSPRGSVRERAETSRRAVRRTAPAPPAPKRPAAPPKLPPRKHAVSPAQAECVRATFAALLWHEGVVHDAIACAAFLKFHPRLPKQGTRVVTRAPHDPSTKPLQRHSVEVYSNDKDQNLNINPSTLESLERSGAEASASRARKTALEAPPPISEDEPTAHASQHNAPGRTGVVDVLPPALRALVALWDTLADADQLACATDKHRKHNIGDKSESDSEQKAAAAASTAAKQPSTSAKTPTPSTGAKKKGDWNYSTVAKVPYSVRCELCGTVPPPLSAHLRHSHRGCGAHTRNGYDRTGEYAVGLQHPVACGQLAQAYNLWYSFCEACRDKAFQVLLKKESEVKAIAEQKRRRLERIPEFDYNSMRENALFLLDMASVTSSESSGNSWFDGASRSASATNSIWLPAPPFQCLEALGAVRRPSLPQHGYHSLRRPHPPVAAALADGCNVLESEVGIPSRVHRSVSMGQTSGRTLAHAAGPLPMQEDDFEPEPVVLSGSGLSLLTQPSAALQHLVGCGDRPAQGARSVSAFEPPRLDPAALMRRPALAFVLGRRDLHTLRQKMDAAVRINTVRQYAFEALNWLLRSVTQPTCVHDVMWWYCSALDKFTRFAPTIPNEDNRQGASASASETHRGVAVPPASAVCPGGRAARSARASFHSFLGSVSVLAPNLQPSGPLALQAVRCWAMYYTHHDRAFLHRSQVFSVISKILSRAEDGVHEEGIIGAIQESSHSYLNKDHLIWCCSDVTAWCDVSTSSRQGMACTLTDGSTETFWESNDEERIKPKWIQIAHAGGGSIHHRPHIICLNIDNTRDTANKTIMVSFLYFGADDELIHMQDMGVDFKNASWICYTLPRFKNGGLRVRCELRGIDGPVRVRQLRVLSAPLPARALDPPSPNVLLHALIEQDTLRVFRLLTSQIFGKLLEWEATDVAVEEAHGARADNDDSDLREHVVGILFAGHQLTSLQRQVMSHIVHAIGAEAKRARDDWDTTLICADNTDGVLEAPPPLSQPAPPPPELPDNYCFEMLSLVLALSGSAVGRRQLALRTELLPDLLTLLHTGSERVQRQIIPLLRRMIAEMPPQKMLDVLNKENDPETRVTILEHLMVFVGKAVTLQLKVKGVAFAVSGMGLVKMGDSVVPVPPPFWFMRGRTTKEHAQLVAKLLSDMAEGRVSSSWVPATRACLAEKALRLAQLPSEQRCIAGCIMAPPVWMALASLVVIEETYLNSGGDNGEGGEAGDATGSERAFCSNHDDDTTVAVVECRTCGPLCAECDRFLHLKKLARTHYRQICKEEESAIRIDIHEGCGRAKLFWLLLFVDRRTLKALAEFRCDGSVNAAGVGGAQPPTNPAGLPGLAGICRFCGARGHSGLLAIGNVCADQQCQEYGKVVCGRVLQCGHVCGGVRNEPTCPPCLYGCARAPDASYMLQEGDDMCMICFTDPVQAAPAIVLTCGHVFHLHCCKKVLATKWNGPRITFSFARCPICKEDMCHWSLEEMLAPIRRLQAEVKRKAEMRLAHEGLTVPPTADNAATFAIDRYAYYVCHKCEKAYFGGLARCEAEMSGKWEPSELVCGACSDTTGARMCPKHGVDFLEYKCRYCCSVAVFFCFGTSHFCNACHDDFQRITNVPTNLLPRCPAGPKAVQLPGTADECPLQVEHPPTGEEYALGCGVCRHTRTF